MASVSFEHVSKHFNKVEVVHDLSLQVRDKEFLHLVGPSDCGKSTCLRMIAGLEETSEETIQIGERVVNDLSPKEQDVALFWKNRAFHEDQESDTSQGLKGVRESQGLSREA